jgi:hypothetical protein
VERLAPRDDHADGNGPVGVQPFEIFEIAIVERILVVPFDFERDARAIGECANMVDFVRLAFSGNIIDALFDDERRLQPILVCVPLASPPPPAMISSMGIEVSVKADSSSAAASGKSLAKIALA